MGRLQTILCNGGGETFLAVMFYFFGFWPPFLTVFKLLIAFNSFFNFKNKILRRTQAVLQMSTTVKPHVGMPPPQGAWPSPVQLLQEAFLIWLYQHVHPLPLEANPPTPSSSRLQ